MELNVNIRVQGEIFHLLNPANRAKDAIQKIMLEGQGSRVVDIYAEDTANRLDYVMEQAIRGVQVSFAETI